MPSVMTIEGATCKYVITQGEYGRRSFHGCFSSKAAATKAARRRGRGWRVVFSRPPGVPMGGLGSTKTSHAANIMRESRWVTDAAKSAMKYGYSERGCRTAISFLSDGFERLGAAKAHLSSARGNPGQRTLKNKHYDAVLKAESAIKDAKERILNRCGVR